MKLKGKILGLGLATAFALGATGASAAEFHSGAGLNPNPLSGIQSTGHVFTTNAGTVTCTTVSFSAGAPAGTTSSLTLTPNYDKCSAFGFINTAIDENGCAYVLHAGGTSEIECPSGKKIEITAPFCTTTVGPQHLATGGNTFHTVGSTPNRHITTTTHISNEIDYNECGTNRTNGTYTGTTTVKGASGEIWTS